MQRARSPLRQLLIAPCVLLFAVAANAAQWAQSFGLGGRTDQVLPIAEGGGVAAGSWWSTETSSLDTRVWRFDADGRVVWQKVLRRDDEEYLPSLQRSSDGGYVAAGLVYSAQTRESDAWVVKLDASGGVVWQRAYGGAGPAGRAARSVHPVAGGGYIVAGSVSRTPDESDAVVAWVLWSDAWLLRLDEDGNPLWEKQYGGALDSWANAVRPTPDGGFVVAGSTFWLDSSRRDAWVLKLDARGEVEWQRSYGGPGEEQFESIEPTPDGGFVAAGYTFSFGAGNQDAWVVRLDASGSVMWQKAYGGPGRDSFGSVRPAPDGGYVVAGEYRLGGVAGSDMAGSPVAWAAKLDIAGSVVWQKIYAGVASYHGAASAQPTADGGYVVGGYAFHPYTEAWILKLDAMGDIAGCAALADNYAAVSGTPGIARETVASVVATTAMGVPTSAVPHDLMDRSVRTCEDPSPAARPRAIEYFHGAFDHYFVTTIPEEVGALDSGVIGGWVRTGQAFYVDPFGAAGTWTVCRFWSGQTFAPKSSHFYTSSSEECAEVKTNPDWMFEGEVFAVGVPNIGVYCGAGRSLLYRLYNQSQGGAPNHRFTTSASARAAMIAEGWVPEGLGVGVLGCVPQR